MQIHPYTTVTGEANFSMETTNLTVGGFSQPAVARSLIDQAGSTEIGLAQRFLAVDFPPACILTFQHIR